MDTGASRMSSRLNLFGLISEELHYQTHTIQQSGRKGDERGTSNFQVETVLASLFGPHEKV